MYTSASCTAISIELENRDLLMQMCRVCSLRKKKYTFKTQDYPFYLAIEGFNIYIYISPLWCFCRVQRWHPLSIRHKNPKIYWWTERFMIGSVFPSFQRTHSLEKKCKSILTSQKKKKKKKTPNKCVINHFENTFEMMVGPMLRDNAFISTNPICLVFCKIAFACKWNGMQIWGRVLSYQSSLFSLIFLPYHYRKLHIKDSWLTPWNDWIIWYILVNHFFFFA